MIIGKDNFASPLWAGFDGKTLPPHFAAWLAKGLVGGVVLFARNIDSPEQVRSLCDEIRAAVKPGDPSPLIAVDQEGGRVARFKKPPYTVFPPARACSLFGNACADIARSFGEAVGSELRASGIDINFAPVLDVDSNPANPVIGDRSFSSLPEEAGRLGIEFAKGLSASGIIPVGKHFPGHGDAATDSHEELPIVEASRETLSARELVPFSMAIQENIPALMTAHVVYPALDPLLPATISEKILGGLLRKKLHFRGPIISDALEMKAISQRWSVGEAALLAVMAGCDIVLVCNGEELQAEAIERIEREARENAIFLRYLETASLRSGRLRTLAASRDRRPPDRESTGSPLNQKTASLLLDCWTNAGQTCQDGKSGNIGFCKVIGQVILEGKIGNTYTGACSQFHFAIHQRNG